MSVYAIEKLQFQEPSDLSHAGNPYWDLKDSSGDSNRISNLLSTVVATTLLGFGTGGICVVDELISTSNLAAHIRPLDPSQTIQGSQALNQISVSQQLSEIRYYLSLNVTNLAEILDVKRPTIYSWQKGESTPHLGNMRKLNQLYSIAQQWKRLSTMSVGKLLTTVFEKDETLLDILCANAIDEGKASTILAKIAQQYTSANDRSSSIEAIAKRHGFVPISDDKNLSSIDLEANHIHFDYDN